MRKLARELLRLGRRIAEEQGMDRADLDLSGRHYKLNFTYQDQTGTVIASGSPSDQRAMANIRADCIRVAQGLRGIR